METPGLIGAVVGVLIGTVIADLRRGKGRRRVAQGAVLALLVGAIGAALFGPIAGSMPSPWDAIIRIVLACAGIGALVVVWALDLRQR